MGLPSTTDVEPLEVQAEGDRSFAPTGSHHLLRHQVTAQVGRAAAEYFGACGDRETAGTAILQLRQPHLRKTFQAVFGVQTNSGNNEWMRGKLLQAVGLDNRWRPANYVPPSGRTGLDSSPTGGLHACSTLLPSQRTRRPPATLQQCSADGSTSGREQAEGCGATDASAIITPQRPSKRARVHDGEEAACARSPTSADGAGATSAAAGPSSSPPMLVLVLPGSGQQAVWAAPPSTAAAAAEAASQSFPNPPMTPSSSSRWQLAPGQLSWQVQQRTAPQSPASLHLPAGTAPEPQPPAEADRHDAALSILRAMGCLPEQNGWQCSSVAAPPQPAAPPLQQRDHTPTLQQLALEHEAQVARFSSSSSNIWQAYTLGGLSAPAPHLLPSGSLAVEATQPGCRSCFGSTPSSMAPPPAVPQPASHMASPFEQVQCASASAAVQATCAEAPAALLACEPSPASPCQLSEPVPVSQFQQCGLAASSRHQAGEDDITPLELDGLCKLPSIFSGSEEDDSWRQLYTTWRQEACGLAV